MTMICPNDKTHEVISTADFCGECGGKLIPEHACPRGHSNPRWHKFCCICGLKLEPRGGLQDELEEKRKTNG